MEKILIYRSLWEEIQDNTLSQQELSEKYEITDDWFIRNVRAFIRNSAGEIAMLFEPRYNRYSTPGWKVDKGETDEEAIRKEVFEELWVVVKSIEWIWCRKSYMRWSKGIYKWFARYCYVDIDWTAQVIEKDKASELQYFGISTEQGKTILRVWDEVVQDNNTIYDRFPWLHTLVNVLPYVPSDPVIWSSLPFILPENIDPNKTYIQWYIPSEEKYIVEEE